MKTNSLDSLRIASPCPASWDSMQGDERVRPSLIDMPPGTLIINEKMIQRLPIHED